MLLGRRCGGGIAGGNRLGAVLMQLTSEVLEILPRSGSVARRRVPRPKPAISKDSAEGTSKKPIAGTFVEITTKQKAARVHRNRQIAATTLAKIKQTISKLEAENASLKTRDAALSKTLADLLAAVAAKTMATEA